MRIDQSLIEEHNRDLNAIHKNQLEGLTERLSPQDHEVEDIIETLREFQVAIPSWALGTGGTRFGRFPEGGEPRDLEEKLLDIGLLHAINRSSGAISLHIPWDIPQDSDGIIQLATELGVVFDAVNSNTFQDQLKQPFSYKFGSLSHTERSVREQAVNHNIEVIHYGEQLGSEALTVWLSDGSCFPGQQDFRKAYLHTLDSLQAIYEALPNHWKLLVEYKPFEPNFYSTVIPDWGTSVMLTKSLGEQALTLVDLGHHLPNTNIEQVVAMVRLQGKLGGFHFNDSKFADDDLTVGSIKPYQLFLIFNELVDVVTKKESMAWMIDASHSQKDPLEDLIQSVEAILIALARSLIVNNEALGTAQESNDPVLAQEVLQDAFLTDVRPLLAEARYRDGGALEPLHLYRTLKVRKKLTEERGTKTSATGL